MEIKTGLPDIIRNHNGHFKKIYKKGEFLYREYEPSTGIFCIDSGNVKIFRNEKGRHERVLHLSGADEILGMHSIINNHPHTNSAHAISETQVRFMPAYDFMEFINSNNTYKLLVMKNLCSHIDQLEEQIIIINEKSANERFADVLEMLHDKYGKNNLNELNISLSVKELAGFTNTTESYMKKILLEFARRGVIRYSEGTIFFCK